MWQQHLYREAETAIKQLDRESDRSAAIIAATVLEHHAEKAAQSRFHKLSKETEWLFDSMKSGPISSFRVKVDLCRLTGIISPDAHADLRRMIKVRNRFAHYPEASTFSDSKVRKFCDELVAFERYAYNATNERA